MENLLFLLLGLVIYAMFSRKPIRIEVKHIYKNEQNPVNELDIRALEQDLIKNQIKEDNVVEQLDNVLSEINDIMGGSDR